LSLKSNFQPFIFFRTQRCKEDGRYVGSYPVIMVIVVVSMENEREQVVWFAFWVNTLITISCKKQIGFVYCKDFFWFLQTIIPN